MPSSRQHVSFVLSDVHRRTEPVHQRGSQQHQHQHHQQQHQHQQQQHQHAHALQQQQQQQQQQHQHHREYASHCAARTHHPHHHQPYAHCHGEMPPCEYSDATMEAAAAMESAAYSHAALSTRARASPPPQLQPPMPPPMPRPAPLPAPPALPRRNGPTCCCSLACLGVAGCLVFCAVLLVELPWVTLEASSSVLQQRRAHAQQQRQQQLLRQQHAGLGRVPPVAVALGLWDEYAVITPLQLTVALSLATGVDEKHIQVDIQGNYFFEVRVQGEGSWLLDAINADGGGAFLGTLNSHASAFGARMVVSRTAATEQAAVANATLEARAPT